MVSAQWIKGQHPLTVIQLLPMWWVIHMCPRFWPPFFTLAGSSTIFLGYFSHPPTAKLSFGVQKLPIFTKIDLFGPKFNFFLDLFGSNFQQPVAHPHQFSGRVPPPGQPPSLDCVSVYALGCDVYLHDINSSMVFDNDWCLFIESI